MQINSYDDLFSALRQNLRQTNSLISLKSELASCKQGLNETVQNFTLRFRQITNEINYLVQSQHVNPTKNRVRIRGSGESIFTKSKTRNWDPSTLTKTKYNK